MADWFGKITGGTLLAGIAFSAFMIIQPLFTPPKLLSTRESATLDECVRDSVYKEGDRIYRQIDVLPKGRELLRIIDEENNGSIEDAYHPGNIFPRRGIDKEKIAESYLSEPHNID